MFKVFCIRCFRKCCWSGRPRETSNNGEQGGISAKAKGEDGCSFIGSMMVDQLMKLTDNHKSNQ